MRSVIFSKFYIAVFTVGFLLNLVNTIDIDNYQGMPDFIYFVNGTYKQENLCRYTRQDVSTCHIPGNPLHTTYQILGDTETKLSAGDDAENYSVLQIICDSEFSINPIAEQHSICINGKWIPPLANCLRVCPSLNSINSTNVKCYWIDDMENQIPLPNCVNPVEGTTVYLSCNTWYEEPNIDKNPIRVCKQGKWDPHVTECYPICGVKRPKGQTNIVNGQNIEIGDYPWQIGIYNAEKEFLCAGSILDYNVVLTAAHCFTDYDGNIKPTENYLIAAGKYYRNYDDERDKFAQYSKILQIHIPTRYKGQINLQEFDIAVLILTDPLKITITVQPVCIELDEESKSLHLSLNKYGTVAGWGYTESGKELSEVLKEIVIPYIPYEECFQTVPLNFRRFITHDKICGGYINSSTSVCGGDSGGSYIFQKLDSDRHFVKGIVSVSPATQAGDCDPNQYSVYTLVDEYIDFIRLHLTYNRIHQSLECKQDECYEEPQIVEDCSNMDDFACKNAKIHCIMPNFLLNAKYSIDQNQKYIPGGYAKVNSVLSLRCYTGFLSKFAHPIQFDCSKKGEWDPPLRTCEDKPGYCNYGNLYVKQGESVRTPFPICGEVRCLDAKTENLVYSICSNNPATDTCPVGPNDINKKYPGCCPKESC